jgi:hypothetical protein
MGVTAFFMAAGFHGGRFENETKGTKRYRRQIAG